MLKNNLVLIILQKELSRLLFFLNPYFALLLHFFDGIKPVLAIGALTLISIYVIYWLLKLYLAWKESTRVVTFLEVTPLALTELTSFTTTQLFSAVHGLAKQRSWFDRLFDISKHYTFELVSTKERGIRYIFRVPTEDSDSIKKNLIAYLPGVKITDSADYLSVPNTTHGHILEFGLSRHFAHPLKKQEKLEEYDPIAYVTATMTKLAEHELVAFQLVVSPIDTASAPEVRKLQSLFLGHQDIVKHVSQTNNGLVGVSFMIFSFFLRVLLLPIGLIIFLFTEGREGPLLPLPGEYKNDETNNGYKELVEGQIKQKIDQQLFFTTLRLYTESENVVARKRIEKGFIAALSPFTNASFQSLRIKRFIRMPLLDNLKKYFFAHRLPSLFGSSILATSEISDLYHFPYTSTTKTEDMVKVHSKELPAPRSVKNNQNLDVVFGKNTYGNVTTNIGLTDEDRSRHVYLIGQTGSGKSTVMFHMASDDMKKGRGIAVVDPHGDLAEDLIANVPEERINDVIYFNPFDIKYPVGINLLELTPNLDDDELELEKELVCESVISIFRRVFNKDENTDAHRIEYILRNTIYTAFTVKDRTVFTIYDLLNDPDFQKSVVKDLTDENLKNFWKNEFGKAGNYQVVKMVSGVTAKVGRFLFSPTAKRVLEQTHSTINFDDILESKKVLICNLTEGKLGEDTSQLLGTTIIAKIQQATLRRVRTDKANRTPFYLFIDEFQNFATSSFTKLLSGGRKFGLRITIAEQSTSQQQDRNIVNVILANTGTVICFRTAGPVDEELMLAQFMPYIQQGDIGNLPRYHFYIKLSAVEPEEPFSGMTMPMVIDKNEEKTAKLIESSRKNYAIVYQKPVAKKVDTQEMIKSKRSRKSTHESVNSLS